MGERILTEEQRDELLVQLLMNQCAIMEGDNEGLKRRIRETVEVLRSLLPE
jgi:hypothetical protein